MSEISALWPIAPSSEASWLIELTGDAHGVTGFHTPGLPDGAWVLNAMYEHELGAGSLSHDELRRIGEEARGGRSPVVVDGHDLSFLQVDGVATGGGVGHAEHPGPGYRRLRWSELARRTSGPVVRDGYLPSYRSSPDGRLPDGSWPVGIKPPTEGALDRPTWNRLIELLVEHSPAGMDTVCFAFYNPLLTRECDIDDHRVLRGRLGDAWSLYDHPDFASTASNLWPQDRSWVTFTDQDLWGTKVSGPAELIEALLDDAMIEAVRLPWDT
ncbi:hypothetical protein Q3V23_04215 [Streptomyces sp. VNUA116]|uniref:hypothetical protein n=1 Tax=Streptomyces sp. VNUA116 TaxID=3062449 RepID=UPI002675A62E|nr:hypothetical protein [Streptomyces sp. VNUA116]WKU43346.1 hypothetical protein Q3V23_04215 [Streptomyces sp. VNUA116]